MEKKIKGLIQPFSVKKKKNFCLHYIISIIFNMNIWREAMQWKDRI